MPADFPPDPTAAPLPYVPAAIPPDPARDARVAARRAADAVRAGRALDVMLSADQASVDLRAAYGAGWREGYAACELHHNRHYARSCETCGVLLLTDRGPHDCETAGRIS